MCNLYTMTATVDELRRVFGHFDGDRDNLPAIGDIYPNYKAPVLRRDGAGLGLSSSSRKRRAAGDERAEPCQPVLALGVEGSRAALPGAGDEIL
jgi:hypothetical protein